MHSNLAIDLTHKRQQVANQNAYINWCQVNEPMKSESAWELWCDWLRRQKGQTSIQRAGRVALLLAWVDHMTTLTCKYDVGWNSQKVTRQYEDT